MAALRQLAFKGRVPQKAFSSLAEEFASTPAAVGSYVAGFGGVETSTLSNGMKVVSKENGSASAAVGVSIGAGSRFASAGEALLLKHMAFKGTTARSDIRLARDIEAAGLTVSSSCGRDAVLLGASGPSPALAEGLEIVAESLLTPKLVGWHVDEVKKESVAVDLAAALKDPQVLLVEKLHEAAYGAGTPMGRALYAAPAAEAAGLAAYLAGLSSPANMTLVGAGLSHAELIAAAESLFPLSGAGGAVVVPASPFVGGSAELVADSPLTHVAIGLAGASSGSPDYYTALVLKQLLAAPGAASFCVGYSDSGLVGLYGAAAPAAAGALAESMVAALKASYTDAQVAAAKLAVKTQLAVSAEDSAALLGELAGSAASAAGVDKVTAAAVKAFAAKAAKSSPALATVGPAAAVPSYSALSRMF
eukprot:CAMPEP_0172597516 /NCGR_PEP_ID=MMETSP1068-20121228/17510_1 /TAXON_ID=35684 /ORGANISM="Pseudopedinella elastica, Strain CCMP716" /LENGTH=419 /DNA_ID=CAMNT_0013397061 /DNA_START=48 /DNA_END=1307 /DNA_ORIENTATION=-